MSKTQIDFTYETHLGTKLYARAEALDFFQAVALIEKFSDWCDENNYTVENIVINRYETKGAEI